MKKTPLSNLQTTAYKISLTGEERTLMRARVMARVHASGAAAVPSRSMPSLYYFFSPQLSMSLAALLVILLVGSGTAYAAEGSLPGDALYTIKTKVNEPIQGALAFSVESKIQFHSAVAQIRLQEAEVLASQDRLDATTSAELESSIDTHITERDALAQKLDDQDPGSGGATLARLNASINAHGDILATLGAESSSSTTRENSGVLAMRVRSGHNSSGSSGAHPTLAVAKMAVPTAPSTQTPKPMMMAFSATEDSSATSSGSTTSAEATSLALDNQGSGDNARNSSHSNKNDSSKKMSATLALGKQATSTLEALRAKVANVKNKIDSDTQAKLNSRFDRIDSIIADGNSALADGNYDDAQDSFNDALDRETTLSAFISAGIQFDGGLLGNLLGNDSRSGDDR